MTIKQVAKAFIEGRSAKCHNAHTDGVDYTLHRTVIARKHPTGMIEFNWGGWYTTTTANHMNHILAELGKPRVGHAQARNAGERTFLVDVWEAEELLEEI